MITQQTEVTDRGEAQATIGFFERWLTVWVFLCIGAGIAIGQLMPGPIKFIGSLEVAKVNIPVGILIWLMIVPMLLKRICQLICVKG